MILLILILLCSPFTLQLLKPEFLLYLDSEIEGQESNSATENMLVTVKLRLLDEIGRGYVVHI